MVSTVLYNKASPKSFTVTGTSPVLLPIFGISLPPLVDMVPLFEQDETNALKDALCIVWLNL